MIPYTKMYQNPGKCGSIIYIRSCGIYITSSILVAYLYSNPEKDVTLSLTGSSLKPSAPQGLRPVLLSHSFVGLSPHIYIQMYAYIYIYIYLMAAATAADPKESHHGFVEGTGRYGRAASSRSAGLEPRC